jgi:hypothetical protein
VEPIDPFHAVKQAAIADALKRFGTGLLTPHQPPPGGYGPGMMNKLKGAGNWIGEAGRSAFFGDPLNMVNEVKTRAASEGMPKAVGGFMKDFYLPPSLVNAVRGAGTTGDKVTAAAQAGKNWLRAAMGSPRWARAKALGLLGVSAGMPAMSLYQAAKRPEDRGRNIGSAVAGLAAAPFTSRMGMFGLGIPASLLAQRLGGAVGGMFDRPRPQLPPADYSFPSNQAYQAQGVL